MSYEQLLVEDGGQEQMEHLGWELVWWLRGDTLMASTEVCEVGMATQGGN